VVYISAASDLPRERETLGRIAAEIPVEIGWRTVLSPTGDGPLDWESIQYADIHFLLLGGDIRAPIGQEWIIARQTGRQPIPYIKTDILRTTAAIDFRRFISSQAVWKPFSNISDLRWFAIKDIIHQLFLHPLRYDLSLDDLEKIQAWLEQNKLEDTHVEYPKHSGTDSSSLILSPEEIASRGGVIINHTEE
jgi:hypothetical protein